MQRYFGRRGENVILTVDAHANVVLLKEKCCKKDSLIENFESIDNSTCYIYIYLKAK